MIQQAHHVRRTKSINSNSVRTELIDVRFFRAQAQTWERKFITKTC